MSSSVTLSATETFTRTNAKYLASKIATDLRRIQSLYGSPTDKEIGDYEREATELLKAGYLHAVTYGFKRNGAFIEPTVRYTARDLAAGIASRDDDPGGIRARADVAGAAFGSFLNRTPAWFALTAAQRETFDAAVGFTRVTAGEPPVAGTLTGDRAYSSGLKTLDRSTVRS